MNINFEKTPNTLFDWAEKFSFEDLNDLQRKEVLLYLSEEDYTSIYEASKGLKVILKQSAAGSHPEKKKKLLSHFDAIHTRKKQIRIKTVAAWQAAAIVLMVLSGWLFYKVFDLQRADTTFQVASADTVYVTKEISAQPEYIHDTIYLYKESSSSSKENSLVNPAASSDCDKTKSFPQPLREHNGSASTPRGNSMKDDSLLKKFGFVAM